MANFMTHLIGATLTTGLCVGAMFLIDILTPVEAGIYLGLGIVGGILPDMDAEKSIPVRAGFTFLGLLVATGGVLFTWSHYPLAMLLGGWILSFLFIRYGLCFLFTRWTVHRGLFHSLPAGFFLSLLIVVMTYHLFEMKAERSWLAGCVLLLGFITHLCLDELYSVDLFNVRIKKSFGTALKLGSSTNLFGTFLLYAASGLLAYHSPPHKQFVSQVWSAKNIDKLRSQIQRLSHGL